MLGGGAVGCLGGWYGAGEARFSPSPFPAAPGLAQACGAEAEWAFLGCPPENECLNGHHDCNETQDCRDLPHGYRCACKSGYTLDK